MSGRVAVRYRREPIMLLYSLWSIVSPSSSGPSNVAIFIGVDTDLSFVMLNFFSRIKEGNRECICETGEMS
jgi:hypothetical protein